MKKWFLIFGIAIGGVFVATSDFSKKSKEAVKQVPQQMPMENELLEAATKGDRAAQHLLANSYVENFYHRKRQGDSDVATQNEIDQALMWFEKSAAQGFAPSKYDMGMIYKNGIGVPLDGEKSLVLIREAADQGYAPAQKTIGWFYEEAQGVARDYQQAITWYRKAAAQDHADAQYNLGKMYAEGRGVTEDAAEAKEWFKMAAHGGSREAEKALEKIERGQHR